MPWRIVEEEPRCPASRPWAVVQEGGEVKGCHETREKALKQQAVLYRNERMNTALRRLGKP